MQVPTNYKMGSGLAATIMGQQAGLEAESQGLQNLTQAMRQPQEMYKSEEAMAQMNDPRYIQMKIQNDMAKFGKETSINEIESAYNNANRAAAHLKAASAMGPEALQQASLQYLQKMNIDPNSEQGQILLKDPIGNAEKMVQFYATAATNNPEYLQKYSLEKSKAEWHTSDIEKQIAGHEKAARITAGAGVSRMNEQERREINRARRGLAFKDPVELEQGLTTALDNNVDPITFEPLTPETRAYYTRMRSAATTAVAKKQKTISFNFGDGTTTATSPAPAPASSKGSAAEEEAKRQGF